MMVKFLRMVNTDTGVLFDVDSRLKRVHHLVDRLRAWCDTASMVLGDYRLVMVTLTYAPGESWMPDDFSTFMNKMSHLLGDNLLSYCWVDELQTAHRDGVPHYHCLLMVKRGVDVPAPDTALMWSKGSSQRATARSVYYLMEYVKKPDQKGLGEYTYPPGARIFGASWRHLRLIALQQGQKVMEYARSICRLTMFPRWVRDICKSTADVLSVQHIPSGGWILGNHVYKSPWRVIGVVYGES